MNRYQDNPEYREAQKARMRELYAKRGLTSGTDFNRRMFHNQKYCAKRRGVGWHFTFDEWMRWWGADLSKRGAAPGDLCMARFGDDGPYAPWNCYKATNHENRGDRNRKVAGYPTRYTGKAITPADDLAWVN